MENIVQKNEIDDLLRDKVYGLPMHNKLTIETYNEKKERFSKLEDFLMNQISETENEMLMHTFLRWQKTRSELNQMYTDEMSKLVNSENQLNTNWEDSELHPDSEKLLAFYIKELRLKMISNQKKYGYSNEWLTYDWEKECSMELRKHLDKGDPKDVAIYAMFMMYRGWSTKL